MGVIWVDTDELTRRSRVSAGRPIAVAWFVILALALGLGVFADLGHHLPRQFDALPELGLPWVLLAFAAGRHSGRARWLGPVLGPVPIVAGLAGYIAFKYLAYGPDSVGAFRSDGPLWLFAAIVVGGVFGAAGRSTRSEAMNWRAVGWGAIAGVAAAEAVAFWWRFEVAESTYLVGFAELLVAGGLAVYGLRQSSQRVLIATFIGTALMGAAGIWALFNGIDTIIGELVAGLGL